MKGIAIEDRYRQVWRTALTLRGRNDLDATFIVIESVSPLKERLTNGIELGPTAVVKLRDALNERIEELAAAGLLEEETK